MKRIAPILVAALASLGLSACSSTPYAAKVNGVIIKSSTIDEEVRAITSNPAYADGINNQLASAGGLRPGGPNTVNAQYTASLLYDQVLTVLIKRELRAEHITVTPDQRKATLDSLRSGSSDPTQFDTLAASYKNYIVDSQTALQALLDARSSVEAQQKYYNDNAKKYTEVCLRQMTVADEASGNTIKAQLEAGGDFGALAQQAAGAAGVTYDASLSQPQCITEDKLSDYAASVLNPIGINGVSAPLQTSNGFALVQVTGRNVKAFADVQSDIKTSLSDRDTLFASLLAKASIKVNPRYGEFRPADQANSTSAGIFPKAPVALSGKAQSTTETTVDPNADPNAGLSSGGAPAGGASTGDGSTAPTTGG